MKDYSTITVMKSCLNFAVSDYTFSQYENMCRCDVMKQHTDEVSGVRKVKEVYGIILVVYE